MAETNLKKQTEGYGYKYTDLAAIHNYFESKGITYWQYTETAENGFDYIFTVPVIDGEELPPRRGCRVEKATLSGKVNPAQEQGSAITYARRYSLLMAFGLATTDDDAQCMTIENPEPASEAQVRAIEKACASRNVNMAKFYENHNCSPATVTKAEATKMLRALNGAEEKK